MYQKSWGLIWRRKCLNTAWWKIDQNQPTHNVSQIPSFLPFFLPSFLPSFLFFLQPHKCSWVRMDSGDELCDIYKVWRSQKQQLNAAGLCFMVVPSFLRPQGVPIAASHPSCKRGRRCTLFFVCSFHLLMDLNVFFVCSSGGLASKLTSSFPRTY